MEAQRRVVLSWSGGKDAALALDRLRTDPSVRIDRLLTTIGQETDRSSMHGIRRELHARQAASIGLSIDFLALPDDPDNQTYEAIMTEVTAEYASAGIDAIAFADIYLEDVRAYREDRLDNASLSGTWPLWGEATEDLIGSFLDRGFRATIVVIDEGKLDAGVLGEDLSRELVEQFPDDVDPCGESGAFHTFVWDGPVFAEPVAFEQGETVTRELGETTYRYRELQPVRDDSSSTDS